MVGLLLHWRPRSFVQAIAASVTPVGGVLIQYPMYAGIVEMLTRVGARRRACRDSSCRSRTSTPIPVLVGIYSAFLGLVHPVGGRQVAHRGAVPARARPVDLEVHLGWVVQTYNATEALANLIHPFWMLPLVGILGLKARDIVGYSMLQFVVHVPLVLFLVWILNYTLTYVAARAAVTAVARASVRCRRCRKIASSIRAMATLHRRARARGIHAVVLRARLVGRRSARRARVLHGVAGTAFVLVFAVQAWLIAAGREAWHRNLGVAGALLAAAFVLSGAAVTVESRARATSGSRRVCSRPHLWTNAAPLTAFALLARRGIWQRRVPARHKRLMLLAAVVLLPPATGRLFGPLDLAWLNLPCMSARPRRTPSMTSSTRGRPHALSVWPAAALVAIDVTTTWWLAAVGS